MSTRATYEIDGHAFYIHHDGYPEGAASYFYAAVLQLYNGAGGLAEAFVRANERAEFCTSHLDYGDTEYRYTLDTSTWTLWARHRSLSDDTREFRSIFTGQLWDFVNERAGMIPDFSPLVPEDMTGVMVKRSPRIKPMAEWLEEAEAHVKDARTHKENGWTGNAAGLLAEAERALSAYERGCVTYPDHRDCHRYDELRAQMHVVAA